MSLAWRSGSPPTVTRFDSPASLRPISLGNLCSLPGWVCVFSINRLRCYSSEDGVSSAQPPEVLGVELRAFWCSQWEHLDSPWVIQSTNSRNRHHSKHFRVSPARSTMLRFYVHHLALSSQQPMAGIPILHTRKESQKKPARSVCFVTKHSVHGLGFKASSTAPSVWLWVKWVTFLSFIFHNETDDPCHCHTFCLPESWNFFVFSLPQRLEVPT